MTASRTGTADREIFIPAAQGRAFAARAGEYLTLIDVEGQQIGDFVALNAADHRERLSTCYTRTMLRRIYAGQGDQLYTNLRRPIFAIVDDVVGRHDLTIAACDATHYAQRFGLPDHPNCLDNLSGALASYGIEQWQVPEPFNVWQNTAIDADGHYQYAAPLTQPGTRIVLQAVLDVVGAVSACAHDLGPVNGGRCTPLLLRISANPPV
jgi:uncharacterized protein YcgI (DUF1989 family)